MEHNIKMKLSILDAEAFRIRSYSCRIPDMDEYCLEYVPKLKPKKHDALPSPMNLNSKALRHLKRNTKSRFLAENNYFYISCPETNDVESDSTEETTCPFSLGFKPTRQASKKFMEEEKITFRKQSFCKEFEEILNNNMDLDYFNLQCDENQDLQFSKYKRASKSPSKKKFPKMQTEEEYQLLKSLSSDVQQDDYDKKGRSSSILRLLENNLDEKIKITTFDA